MSSHHYRPVPIDTSKVRLPREVEELTEKVSRNGHEIWAQQSLAMAGAGGRRETMLRKLHSSPVPCEELSESEKI